MNYHVYYFSATGNTERVAGHIGSGLEAKGHSVSIVRINRNTTPLPERPDVTIVAFPVLAWAAPAFVSRFVRKLRGIVFDGRKPLAAVVSCDGGGGLQAPEQMRRMLARRGFDVFLTGAVSYPENWRQIGLAADPATCGQAIARGDTAVGSLVDDLATLVSKRVKIGAIASVLTWIAARLFGIFGRRFLGKMHVADYDCTSCGLCVRTCPVGSIVLGKRKKSIPFWRFNCESCNRCINICPENAINSSFVRIIVLVFAITALAFTGIIAYFSYLREPLGLLVRSFSGVIDAIVIVVIIFGSHWVGAGPVDSFILRPIQCLPFIRPLFAKSFTKHAPRYTAPAFGAPIEK
jgi:ferredoxin